MCASTVLVEAAFPDDGRAERNRTEDNENLRRATALLRLAAEVVLHCQYSLEQVSLRGSAVLRPAWLSVHQARLFPASCLLPGSTACRKRGVAVSRYRS